MRLPAFLTFVLFTANCGVAQGSPPTLPDRTGSFGASQEGAPETCKKQTQKPILSVLKVGLQPMNAAIGTTSCGQMFRHRPRASLECNSLGYFPGNQKQIKPRRSADLLHRKTESKTDSKRKGLVSHLIALVFEDQFKGEEARAALRRMAGEGLLNIADTVLIA